MESPKGPKENSSSTPRGKRRTEEDIQYTPVIIKRSDEARRHPDDILEHAIAEGMEQLNRPALSLFLSSVVAGLILGFTAMSVATVLTLVLETGWMALERVATALVYPTGFIICMMSGAELFTEHTATAVYPVLDRRASAVKMLRLWVLVIAGNLVGALLAAGLLYLADGSVGARVGYIELGKHLFEMPFSTLFASSVLAGALMAMGAWLVLSTPPTVSQLASIYVVTFVIGLGGLHHSIAGSVEAFCAFLMSDSVAAADVFRFVGIALVGNLVGGGIFVAGFNYAHVRKSRTGS